MTLKSDTGPFALVPDWVLRLGLSSRAIHLYAVLSRFADDNNGKAWPLRSTLAKRMGTTTKSVDRATAELKEAGAISVQARKDSKGQHSNLYTIHRVQPRGSILSPPLDKDDLHPLDTGVAQNENQIEREPTTCEPSSLEGKRRKPRPPDPIYDGLVEAFGRHPQTDSERGMWNRACKELRAADAFPAQILSRAGAWRMKYPNAHLTPIALAKHWGALGPADPVRYVAEPDSPPNLKKNTANIRQIRADLGL